MQLKLSQVGHLETLQEALGLTEDHGSRAATQMLLVQSRRGTQIAFNTSRAAVEAQTGPSSHLAVLLQVLCEGALRGLHEQGGLQFCSGTGIPSARSDQLCKIRCQAMGRSGAEHLQIYQA
ncbi:unnamed protein product [Symbiodinium pilosum]|uniref:Uncharacterized protein n=1 Tax=Symbiodinium pilosum TaxID=2952 RepID=A0A812IUC7_SYMPI|nr:unnamed protein product [Symbiodinium pilosum]